MAPEQSEREKIVRDKFLIDGESIRGKRVLLVDDSIVRGTTMKVIVDMLLEMEALSVTVLSCSPIVHYGDRFGIAMSTNELVGIDHSDGTKLSSDLIEMRLFYNSYTGRQKARLFYPSLENFL
jgi:amidophosphoribosyltransferase